MSNLARLRHDLVPRLYPAVEVAARVYDAGGFKKTRRFAYMKKAL